MYIRKFEREGRGKRGRRGKKETQIETERE
jgi:hypothetical protein